MARVRNESAGGRTGLQGSEDSERSAAGGETLRRFQLALARRLLSWAVPSMAAGLAAAFLGTGFWRGLGIQAAAWGAVDAVIALLARLSALRGRREGSGTSGAVSGGADVQGDWQLQARRLRRILWINAALDGLYVSGGVLLSLTLGRSSAAARGHGLGIALQGAFLLIFDVIHALAAARLLPAPGHIASGGGPDAAEGGPNPEGGSE